MESEDSSYYPKGCYQSGNSPELYVYFNTNSNGAIHEKSQTICFASNGDGKKILHFSILGTWFDQGRVCNCLFVFFKLNF